MSGVSESGPLGALQIELHFAEEGLRESAPEEGFLLDWARRAMQGAPGSLSVRLVDRSEITALNHQYRDKHAQTNVLSFECDLPAEIAEGFLGDVVICVPVVVDEAIAQNKNPQAHFAHMVVHGVLHLRGYDHIEPDQALEMEQLETQLLALEGIACPYTETLGENTSSHG